MNAAAQPVTDERETKIKLVIAALGRNDDLSRAERALLDEVEQVPSVKTARAAYSARLEEAARLSEAARLAALREAQDQREAERVERVAGRRKLWREADPLVRALHVLAERLQPDRQAKTLLALVELLERPRETLITRRRYERASPSPERNAPPLSFAPDLLETEHDDPLTGLE